MPNAPKAPTRFKITFSTEVQMRYSFPCIIRFYKRPLAGSDFSDQTVSRKQTQEANSMIHHIDLRITGVKLTLLCGLLVLTTTVCRSSADVSIALQKNNAPRALWVWDAGVASNANDQQVFLAFCSAQHINTVFLSLGDFDDVKKLPDENRNHLTTQQLGDFLERAHAAKIKVEGLGGDPLFALTRNHHRALDAMKRVLNYNKTAATQRRLDGYQWDVEPYILKEFKTDQHDSVLEQYLDFVNAATTMVKASSANQQFALGFAVPFWFDTAAQNTKWQDKTQPAVFQVLDILSQVPDSYIAIMAYRDHAEGSNGSIGVSQTEMNYANAHTPKVGIWVGMETGDVQPASITFHGKTNADLEKAISEVNSAFASSASYRGVAIHHWGSYRELIKR